MIEPDTKDWTWVLERRCQDCGFDAAGVSREDIGRLLRDNVAAWQPVLARPDVRIRPDAATWSPLEYACHVRDVFRLFAERLALMLDEDGATFANWDQDATAIEDDYGSQDPDAVWDELARAGRALADAFDAVPDDAWQRRGTRSDGARFTIETFATYLVHDPTHHLWDVGA